MIIERKPIKLINLGLGDIERVRNWRNQDRIRNQMIFDQVIENHEQEKWFSTLNENSIYMMIHSNSEPIGLIHCKEINWKKKVGEAGIFIGDEKYSKKPLVIESIILFMDFLFSQMKMKELYAKVKNDNTIALEMNLGLGYRLEEENSSYSLLCLDKEHYLINRNKLLSGTHISEFDMIFEDDKQDHFWKIQSESSSHS